MAFLSIVYVWRVKARRARVDELEQEAELTLSTRFKGKDLFLEILNLNGTEASRINQQLR